MECVIIGLKSDIKFTVPYGLFICRIPSLGKRRAHFFVVPLHCGLATITSLRPVLFVGVFTPHDTLAKEVFAASEAAGEKLWRMPLEDSYWESMKSGVADMVNTGGRQGGAITAALFLKQVKNLMNHFSSLLPK